MKRKTCYKMGLIYLMVNLTFLIFFILFVPYPSNDNTSFFMRTMNTCGSVYSDYGNYLYSMSIMINFPLIYISTFLLFQIRIKSAIILGILGNISHGYVMILQIFSILGCYYLEILMILITGLFSLVISVCISLFLLILMKKLDFEEENKIRQSILELGTRFTRITIKEISENTKIDRVSIAKVVTEMFSNQEIYGEYFKSTRSISFNQRANIAEIDRLMEKYKEWEEEQISKK